MSKLPAWPRCSLPGAVARASLLVLGGVLVHASGCSSTGSSGSAEGGSGGAGEGGEGAGAIAGGGSGAGSGGGGRPPVAGSGGDGGATAGAAGAGDAGAPDEPLPACAESRITALGADVAVGTTVDGADRFAASCGAGKAPDLAFEWVVPATDYYSLSTEGSDFDTVLSLRAACDGAELSCNDNASTEAHSLVVDEFEAGERLIIVVDGNAGEEGEAHLAVERVACPETDLRGQPFPLALTTAGGTNAHAGACGGAGVREKSYRFIAPSAGLYRFSVSSEVFDPALHVEDGAMCGSPLLQCNPGRRSDWPTRVTRYLTPGQAVTLIVDSTAGEGSFELDAERLTGATCPALPFQDDADVVIDTDDADVLSGSCQAAGNNRPLGTPTGLQEHSMPLEIAMSESSVCTYQIDADRPFVSYLIRGTRCDGPESACTVAAQSPDGSGWRTSHRFGFADNGDYVLVIEPSTSGIGFTYTISPFCLA